jgi:hypothetical protein
MILLGRGVSAGGGNSVKILYYSAKLPRQNFKVTVRSMMGSHPDFVVSRTPERLENIPYNGHCYLYARNNGQWIMSHPYVQFEKCPVCHHPKILLVDGQQYLDSYEGHRVTLA